MPIPARRNLLAAGLLTALASVLALVLHRVLALKRRLGIRPGEASAV